MQPTLLKGSAKNRLSEGKENIFSFLSVRFLFKSKTIQNKGHKTFIFIVEMQPTLLKCSVKWRDYKIKIDLFLRYHISIASTFITLLAFIPLGDVIFIVLVV